MLRGMVRAIGGRALLTMIALGTLGACGAGERTQGYVELLVRGGCEGSAALRLEGTVTDVVEHRELCEGRVVRELPAGLYRLSWQASAADARQLEAAPPLESPPLLSVIAGRSTVLRLSVQVAPPPELEQAVITAEGEPVEPGCSELAAHAGPS